MRACAFWPVVLNSNVTPYLHSVATRLGEALGGVAPTLRTLAFWKGVQRRCPAPQCRSARRPLFAIAWVSSVAACAVSPDEPTPVLDARGSVVFGITSDFEPLKDVARVAADLSIDGVVQERKTWSIDGEEKLRFPFELTVSDLVDGAKVDVMFSTFQSLQVSESPFLLRQAATSAVAGQRLLLRAHLEWECVPGFQLGAEKVAPTCVSPETCVAAACQDPYVAPGTLEPYSPDWAVEFADVCRPVEAGPPEVTIGQGIETFTPISQGDKLAMFLGNQGGYHVWLALRMKNLHRTGSKTTILVSRPDTGEELCGATLPRDFSPSAAGACDLTGIQCIVSYDVLGGQTLQGKTVLVSAKVVDITGDVAFATKEVLLGTGG